LPRTGHFGKPFDVDTLTLFGLFAVTAMLITYAFEQRSPWFILAGNVSRETFLDLF
jgi:hypothetical protein